MTEAAILALALEKNDPEHALLFWTKPAARM